MKPLTYLGLLFARSACAASLFVSVASLHAATESDFDEEAVWGQTSMSCTGGILRVSTGRMERCWQITPEGLRTIRITDSVSLASFSNPDMAVGCDWQVPGIVAPGSVGHLESLTARDDDDEGFTSRHLEVVATFSYPDDVSVRFVIWAFPQARGIRTQVWLRGHPTKETHPTVPGCVDWIPAPQQGQQQRYFGYYNDTQNRNDWNLPILREEVREERLREGIDWASAACIEGTGGGIMLVKESHKCVNQQGVGTGGFAVIDGGLANTGLRLAPSDLSPDRYRWAWASWCIAYDGTDADRELALKTFYSVRYPIVPERDVYALANTWGSSGLHGITGQQMSQENEVLAELESVARLGIDGLQIDDGWEGPDVDKVTTWRPDPAIYPSGWSRVADRAHALGLRLGLWAVSTRISLEDMKWNYTQAHFLYWKLDFAELSDADAIDNNMAKTRDFLKFTGMRAQTIWDVTEIAPRYGYYWAREYGPAWLANRKPTLPVSVVYKPAILLRDIWQLSRYVPLNKVQIPVQNINLVDPAISDARRYNQLYCVAIGLAGIPCFFQTTRFYSTDEHANIRALLTLWKRHREALFESCIFPVGDTPTGRSWSGFQFRYNGSEGYLLLFREVDNDQATHSIVMRYLANKDLEIDDLCKSSTRTVAVGPSGAIDFTIPQAAGFLFVRYRVK
jgi:hypothetical protein